MNTLCKHTCMCVSVLDRVHGYGALRGGRGGGFRLLFEDASVFLLADDGEGLPQEAMQFRRGHAIYDSDETTAIVQLDNIRCSRSWCLCSQTC